MAADYSGWEVYRQDEPQAAPSPMASSQNGDHDYSDWEVVPEVPASQKRYPNEGLGTALLKTLPRVGEDLYKGGAALIKNAPQYYESAKNAIPNIYNAVRENPGSAAKQGVAGFAELGQNAFNLPHDIINYGANRLNLIPQGFNEKVQMGRMPSDTEQRINQLFGQPKNAGEEDIRWTGRNVDKLLGGAGLARSLNPMNLTARSIANDVVNTRNANRARYGRNYTNLFNDANAHGVGDMRHVVPNIDIRTMRRFAPESKLTRVMELVNNPTAQTAHLAKSDLLGIQRQLNNKASLTGGERRLLDATNNAIDAIRNNMFRDRHGNINQGLNNRYNALQEGYEREVVPYTTNNAIKKFARRNPKITASALVNSLSKGEFAAQRAAHHPAIGVRNVIKKHYGKVIGGAAGLTLYHNLMGTHNESE